MSHQQKVCFTRKRHRDEEMERALMEHNTELQTKITDVNNDCLEKIFMHLDVDDFINIAHTNKELKPAADMAFVRKFGKKQLILKIFSTYSVDNSVEVGKKTLKVFDFQTSLRLLRCFGHLFSKFDVQPETAFHGLNIVSYINECCSESLVDIILRDIRAGSFEGLKKPFANARVVYFIRCTLDGKLAQLSSWFPAMRQLRLRYNYTALDHIDANSPDLRELILIGRGRYFSVYDLRLGPRLCYLHLNVNGWIGILQNASGKLASLRSLQIGWNCEDFDGVGDHIFNFGHLNKLQMDFNGFKYQSTPRVPVTFQGVQEFIWEPCIQYPDQNLIEFFEKHSTITKLTSKHFHASVMNGDITSIANVLPLLQEVNFEYTELSVDKVIPFLNKAILVKKMAFLMTSHSEFERLKTLLDEKWQASIDGQCVELEYNLVSKFQLAIQCSRQIS